MRVTGSGAGTDPLHIGRGAGVDAVALDQPAGAGPDRPHPGRPGHGDHDHDRLLQAGGALSPTTAGRHDGMDHGGTTPMPGTMTDEQMAQLGAAVGTEFDRMWPTGRIAHHQGAVDNRRVGAGCAVAGVTLARTGIR